MTDVDEIPSDLRGFDGFGPAPELEDCDYDPDEESDPYPQMDISPVFWTPEGKRFHADRNCRGISDSERRQTAGSTKFMPAGRTPCEVCIGDIDEDDTGGEQR